MQNFLVRKWGYSEVLYISVFLGVFQNSPLINIKRGINKTPFYFLQFVLLVRCFSLYFLFRLSTKPFLLKRKRLRKETIIFLLAKKFVNTASKPGSSGVGVGVTTGLPG